MSDYRRDNLRALEFIGRLTEVPNVGAVSMAQVFCAKARCEVMSPDGKPYYFDDNHLSMTGARHLASSLVLQAAPAFEPSEGR